MPSLHNLIDKFNKRDIDMISVICGNVLYTILNDEIDDNVKFELFKKVSLIHIYRDVKLKTFNKVYGEKYPELAKVNKELIEEGTDSVSLKLDTDYVSEKNNDNLYSEYEPRMSEKYNLKELNPLLTDMVEGIREIGKLLDKYIKDKDKEMIGDEKFYVGIFKRVIDDYAKPVSPYDKMMADPMYYYSVNEAFLKYPVNPVTVDMTYSSVKKEPQYKLLGAHEGSYKDTVNAMGDTILFKTLAVTEEILRKEDEYKKSGDVNRKELIDEYKRYLGMWDERLAMTEEEFKPIKAKAHLQNDYGDFINGRRSPRFMRYDTEGRIKLLEAGYPKSDIAVLAQVYSLINSIKDDYDEADEKDKKALEFYRELNNAFEKLLRNTPLTPKTRLANLNSLHLVLLEGRVYRNTGYTESIKKLENSLDLRIKAALPAEDAMLIGSDEQEAANELESLYEHIRHADESKIPSSSEFKKMKEALRKLSLVDRDKYPDRYEALKDNAIKSTEAYIKYKRVQYRAGGHKRSDYEMRRVMAANSVYDRLREIDRSDRKEAYEIMQGDIDKDADPFIENALSPDKATQFVRAVLIIGIGRKQMLDKLNQYKQDLINTQEHKNYNFDNTDKSEGSSYYTAMTKSLQKCIDVISNDRSTPVRIKEALNELMNVSHTYYYERKGAGSPKGTTRLTKSEEIEKCARNYMSEYDMERLALEKYKDRFGNSCMSRSYRDIKELSDKYIQKYNGNEDFTLSRDIYYEFERSKMEKISAGLNDLRLEVKKACPFIADIYTIDRGFDYYASAGEAKDVETLASIYVGKKYLDKIYDRENLDIDNTDNLREQINVRTIKAEVNKLSKNPIFKACVSKDPYTCISSFKEICDKADILKESMADKFEALLVNKDGDEYEDDLKAIAGSKEDFYMASARYAVYRMLSSESGELIRQAIAADESGKASDDFIEELVYTTCDFINKDTHKGFANPALYVLNGENGAKIYENILNNSWKISRETTDKSENFVYKAMAGTDRKENMREWARINERAKEIQENCKNTVEQMRRDSKGKPYGNDSAAIYTPIYQKLTNEDDVTLASRLIVNRIISEKGKIIAQAIAADRSTDPELFIDMLINTTKEYILSKTNDGRSNRGEYALNSNNYNKIYEKVLKETKQISHIDRLNVVKAPVMGK